ncbi:MFS transporter [uncultured Caulobacter sp.]|uniref:MFS transporter n=1 Tax=uncultured Caulobacter sp. TaxID=158749 RepID=UPI0026397AE0|nr:MFS transporter [uncultured Caulobacter sp.]
MDGASRRISAGRLLAYAGPALPVAMALYAVSVVLPGLLTETGRISPAELGLVLLLTRVADVGFDIAVGAASDATPGRFGGRKAWIAVGGAVFAASYLALTDPPRLVSGLWLFLALIGFYLGWSMIVVPHNAWGSELAGGYNERSRLFAYRVGAGYAGSLLFAVTPLAPIFATHAFTAETLRATGWIVAGLVAASTLACVALAPSSRPRSAAPFRPAALLDVLRRNRPFQLYAAISVLNGLSNGMFIAVVFLYQTRYLRLADFAWLSLVVYIGANLLALPLWQAVMARLGKTRAWGLGLALAGAVYPPMAVLTPGPGALPWSLLIFAVAGAAFSVSNVATPAVLGDIVDYERLRSGRQLTGPLFAVQSLLDKFNSAIGGGAAFLLIGAFGYSASGPLTPMAVTGLQLSHLFIPTLLNFVALVLLWRFPLTARRQQTIARRLARSAPSPGSVA